MGFKGNKPESVANQILTAITLITLLAIIIIPNHDWTIRVGLMAIVIQLLRIENLLRENRNRV